MQPWLELVSILLYLSACPYAKENIDKRKLDENADQFPFAADISILRSGVWTTFCSGSLVSSNVVLTASQCFDRKVDLKKFKVVFGIRNKNGKQMFANVQERRIIQYEFHPYHLSKGLQSIFEYVLLKLDRPIIINQFVKPIKLLNEEIQNGQEIIQIGFGTNSLGVRDVIKYEHNEIEIQDKMYVCSATNESIMLHGGFGGPAVIVQNREYYQIGVFSNSKPITPFRQELKPKNQLDEIVITSGDNNDLRMGKVDRNFLRKHNRSTILTCFARIDMAYDWIQKFISEN